MPQLLWCREKTWIPLSMWYPTVDTLLFVATFLTNFQMKSAIAAKKEADPKQKKVCKREWYCMGSWLPKGPILFLMGLHYCNFSKE